MFKNFTNTARALKEKTDIGGLFDATKNFSSSKYEASKTEANAVWKKHGVTVERVVVEGLLSIAEEKLRDEKMIEGVLIKLYETLPLPVRFVFSRDLFVAFTSKHRETLLLKVQDARTGKALNSTVSKLDDASKGSNI